MRNISFIIPVYNQEKYIAEILENLSQIEIPGYARNYGVEHSQGAYIAFCDSDDRIHPVVYKKMYEQISGEKKDLIAARYREVYDSGKIIEHAYTF